MLPYASGRQKALRRWAIFCRLFSVNYVFFVSDSEEFSLFFQKNPLITSFFLHHGRFGPYNKRRIAQGAKPSNHCYLSRVRQTFSPKLSERDTNHYKRRHTVVFGYIN